MIQAIAIDDEPLALQVLESFCARHGKIDLKKVFTKPHEALKYVQNFPVDLIFLDINMQSMNGLDVKKELDPQIPVVFTTAYSEFAVDGFNLNAVDYLLKPFTFERFEQCYEKVDRFMNLRRTDSSNAPSHMLIRADYSLIKIEFKDILLIEGLDDYIKIHLHEQRPVVARLTMKSVLGKLPEDQFVRIHRSYIVPYRRIESVRNKTVILPSMQLPIGMSYEEQFMQKFSQR